MLFQESDTFSETQSESNSTVVSGKAGGGRHFVSFKPNQIITKFGGKFGPFEWELQLILGLFNGLIKLLLSPDRTGN